MVLEDAPKSIGKAVLTVDRRRSERVIQSHAESLSSPHSPRVIGSGVASQVCAKEFKCVIHNWLSGLIPKGRGQNACQVQSSRRALLSDARDSLLH
jgi:hypothetical protein